MRLPGNSLGRERSCCTEFRTEDTGEISTDTLRKKPGVVLLRIAQDFCQGNCSADHHLAQHIAKR